MPMDGEEGYLEVETEKRITTTTSSTKAGPMLMADIQIVYQGERIITGLRGGVWLGVGVGVPWLLLQDARWQGGKGKQ